MRTSVRKLVATIPIIAYFILRLPVIGIIEAPNLAKVMIKKRIEGNTTAYYFVHMSAITA